MYTINTEKYFQIPKIINNFECKLRSNEKISTIVQVQYFITNITNNSVYFNVDDHSIKGNYNARQLNLYIEKEEVKK